LKKQQILLIFVALLFIACGTTKTKSSNNEDTLNASTQVIEPPKAEISIVTPEENLSEPSLVETFLNNQSDYHMVSMQEETKESVEHYINNSGEYHISSLEKIENPNVEIFYGENKMMTIPKDKIYVISNTAGTQIFVTFDGESNSSQIENYSAIIFQHNTLKIPTGFTNIQLNNITPTSLNQKLEKAFQQIGINNLKWDHSILNYHTDIKNYGETMECLIEKEEKEIIIVLDRNNSFNLGNLDSNITCHMGQDENKTTYQLTLPNTITSNSSNSTTLYQFPIENNNSHNINTDLSQTNIKLIGRVDNRVSHEAYLSVNIENNLIDPKELNITAILTELTNTGYDKNTFKSNTVIGGQKKLLVFKNIPVRLADERRFHLTYQVKNTTNNEEFIIDSKLNITVFGDYTDVNGEITQNNDNNNKFTKDNIESIRMSEDTFNTTHYNTVDIQINRPGEYQFISEVYYNGEITSYVSDTKNINITSSDTYRLQFEIDELEYRENLYSTKLRIIDTRTKDFILLDGASFRVN